MVETSGDTTCPVSEARHIRFDFILAACICLAAVCFWLWNTNSNPGPGGPQSANAAATGFPSQPMEKDRSNPDDSNNIGFRLYSASNYVGAEAQFRKAIRANPKGAVGFCNLGAALIAQRRFDEAIAMLRVAISLDPSLTLAQNNLNWALEEKAKRGK
jgi:tetratricopeptide (TPR) repeat protein